MNRYRNLIFKCWEVDLCLLYIMSSLHLPYNENSVGGTASRLFKTGLKTICVQGWLSNPFPNLVSYMDL